MAESANQHTWAMTLRDIAIKVERATTPRSLPEMDFQRVGNFVNAILDMTGPTLRPKLRQFWDLHEDIGLALGSSTPPVGAYEPYAYMAAAQRLGQTDAMARHTLTSLASDPAAHHVPAALLYVLLARAEDIEHFQTKTVLNAVQVFNLAAKYDAHEMCSVRGKVNNSRHGWQTDIRAYRNCAGHKGITINYNVGSWDIEFASSSHGYNFRHAFTQAEFVRWTDQHTLLYKFQLALLRMQELLPILATHLMRSDPGP